MSNDYLKNIFEICWGRYGFIDSKLNIMFDSLIKQYSEQHRKYHNISHIENVCKKIQSYKRHNFNELMAALYHDIIYDPKNTDSVNVAESIHFFKLHAIFYGMFEKDQEVESLILSTDYTNFYGNEFGKLNNLQKADLSGFNLLPEKFRINSNNIRLEFNHLSDKEFYTGRYNFLLRFKDLFERRRITDDFDINRCLMNINYELENCLIIIG